VSLSSNLRLIIGPSAVVLVAAAIGRPAVADETANLTVTAQVQASCDLTGGELPFGVYTGDENDADVDITYTCTPGTNIIVSLGPGEQLQGSVRTMIGDNGGSLEYGLYQDSSRSIPWGEGPDAQSFADASGGAQTAKVYGRIPAGQGGQAAGSYNDTVLITLVVE
jgi:spore coat protein U-like protein